MQYKTLFAYLSKPSRVPQIMNIATELAKRNDAHLVGCHVLVEPSIPVFDIRAVDLMQPIIQQQKDLGKKNANVLRKTFETAARQANIPFSWNCDENYYHDYSSEITERVRGGDLVVVTQYDENDGQGWKSLPARLAIDSGRPVLVVPFAGEFSGKLDKVFVAWNNSKESTRAIYDSLPVLMQARNVKIVAVEESSGEKMRPAIENVLPALSRHGVTAESSTVVSNDREVTEILYSEMEAFNADLCVIGCYGRSRMQEIIFGGVTFDILKSMPIPVLLSH